jgi:transposase-like protein
MDARLRFVARLPEGEAMTDVCREFGASRKTGYKIFDRYKEHGLQGADRSLAPAGAIRQPVAAADRATHRRLQAREASLGRSQGPRTAGSAVGSAFPHPGQERDPRDPAPARPRIC